MKSKPDYTWFALATLVTALTMAIFYLVFLEGH